MLEQFSIDVDQGLSSEQKYLPSKYFYDKVGDALFVKIMALPEYYLTRAEMDIFEQQTLSMLNAWALDKHQHFELIELGAGDGSKTKKLLSALQRKHYKFDYLPIDISANALDQLEASLARELPDIKVHKQQGDYFKILASLKSSHHPKVVLFLGSSIGNMSDEEANGFLIQLGKTLNPQDKLLLGADLIKPESLVLPAYNDSQGVTRDFNLNLLARINRELGGDFDLNQFKHDPSYTQQEGIAKSYLTSLADQRITVKHTGKQYWFKAGEKIYTEISRKYSDEIIQNIIEGSGFQMIDKLTDQNNLFADYIFNKR
ncbi:L-histidine N(alpha)-methyltransferase [Catenovulum sediminis]|uniref:L-histidine N(alpha)-methyltransferase n=1 Tax=Catenovulum sediminis TaxID=1740262 RepID=UPI00117D751F|nr:L-histidine N(alpha)-methyltransferase [Catenovulum sediminis]